MAKSKASDSELVTARIKKSDAASAKLQQAIRKIILTADKNIGEQIKWNSPGFYNTGEMKPFNP